jgi:hypothetical protein
MIHENCWELNSWKQRAIKLKVDSIMNQNIINNQDHIKPSYPFSQQLLQNMENPSMCKIVEQNILTIGVDELLINSKV